MSEKKEMVRFYRSKLSTIVWDPDKNGELANFSEGHVTTDDPRVIQRLRALGYPEIPVDAQEPPDIVVSQPSMVISGDVPVMTPGAAPIVVESRMKAVTKEAGGPQPASSPVPPQSAEVSPPQVKPGAGKRVRGA